MNALLNGRLVTVQTTQTKVLRDGTHFAVGEVIGANGTRQMLSINGGPWRLLTVSPDRVSTAITAAQTWADLQELVEE